MGTGSSVGPGVDVDWIQHGWIDWIEFSEQIYNRFFWIAKNHVNVWVSIELLISGAEVPHIINILLWYTFIYHT